MRNTKVHDAKKLPSSREEAKKGIQVAKQRGCFSPVDNIDALWNALIHLTNQWVIFAKILKHKKRNEQSKDLLDGKQNVKKYIPLGNEFRPPSCGKNKTNGMKDKCVARYKREQHMGNITKPQKSMQHQKF